MRIIVMNFSYTALFIQNMQLKVQINERKEISTHAISTLQLGLLLCRVHGIFALHLPSK